MSVVLAPATDGLVSSTGLLALIGAGLLVFALAWRTVRLVRLRRGLAAGLRDADPAVRIAAVQQAAELGLASTAPLLLKVAHAERDAGVTTAIVEAVAGRQWEPASTGRIVELRLWAKAYVEAHPEVRRTFTGEPPLVAGVAGTVPAPSLLDPDSYRSSDHQGPEVHTDKPAAAPMLEADPDPLGRVRVLVTGAGGPAGVAVIRALRRRGHHVTAVDADPTAVGLRLADDSHVVPRYDDAHYLAALIRVATAGGVQALICTVAEEYEALATAGEYLEEAGVRTLMPTLDAVRTCTDKWLFAQRMTESGVSGPATGLGSADGVPGPWIIKPRFGRGSRDVHVATSRTSLSAALRATPQPLVQTQLSGREFTVDALVDPSGALVGAAPRWRLETKGGISTKGQTFEDASVTFVVGLVLKAVGLVGPANVQGFVSADGDVTVHEVNPRFSGGLPLSLHAGADVVEEYLRGILGRPMRPERCVARPGVVMLRHFEEVFEQ